MANKLKAVITGTANARVTRSMANRQVSSRTFMALGPALRARPPQPRYRGGITARAVRGSKTVH